MLSWGNLKEVLKIFSLGIFFKVSHTLNDGAGERLGMSKWLSIVICQKQHLQLSTCLVSISKHFFINVDLKFQLKVLCHLSHYSISLLSRCCFNANFISINIFFCTQTLSFTYSSWYNYIYYDNIFIINLGK